jgi:integrase
MLIVRQFARYLGTRGLPAYVPDTKLTPMTKLDFAPYIFTRDQIRHILQAVDGLPFSAHSPERHLVMPELFRLLYGCGLRAGEALRLRVEDVDLDRGVLTIRQSKFRKDRYIPVVPVLANRLRRYTEIMKLNQSHLVFFPNPWGKCYDIRTIYMAFRRTLEESGIPHGGRNKGPRLHDLRHTFAVHRLEQWYRNGDDLNARLPLLVAYLGHQSLAGTQRYLRLTPEIFPEITKRLEAFLHGLTPGGTRL